MIRKGFGNKAILMLHGRGSNAEDIISLSKHFNATSFAFTAINNEWYPSLFLDKKEKNEPYISDLIKLINRLINKIKKDYKKIYILGFSQGACLALEYGALHEVDGVIAFSGGFIGNDNELPKKTKTKNVVICCSSNDPFIPLKRAKKSAEIYKKNNANVLTNFYEANTHTITKEDIEIAKKIITKNHPKNNENIS
jgi:phospholipase/carboxylesterase